MKTDITIGILFLASAIATRAHPFSENVQVESNLQGESPDNSEYLETGYDVDEDATTQPLRRNIPAEVLVSAPAKAAGKSNLIVQFWKPFKTKKVLIPLTAAAAGGAGYVADEAYHARHHHWNPWNRAETASRGEIKFVPIRILSKDSSEAGFNSPQGQTPSEIFENDEHDTGALSKRTTESVVVESVAKEAKPFSKHIKAFLTNKHTVRTGAAVALGSTGASGYILGTHHDHTSSPDQVSSEEPYLKASESFHKRGDSQLANLASTSGKSAASVVAETSKTATPLIKQSGKGLFRGKGKIGVALAASGLAGLGAYELLDHFRRDLDDSYQSRDRVKRSPPVADVAKAATHVGEAANVAVHGGQNAVKAAGRGIRMGKKAVAGISAALFGTGAVAYQAGKKNGSQNGDSPSLSSKEPHAPQEVANSPLDESHSSSGPAVTDDSSFETPQDTPLTRRATSNGPVKVFLRNPIVSKSLLVSASAGTAGLAGYAWGASSDHIHDAYMKMQKQRHPVHHSEYERQTDFSSPRDTHNLHDDDLSLMNQYQVRMRL